MVDENGKTTITNDGATVMKVRKDRKTVENTGTGLRHGNSFSTSFIPPHASSPTSHAHKTPRWETAPPQSSSSPERF